MNDRFNEKHRGDRFTAEEVNNLQDAVERGNSTGHGDDGARVGTFHASRSRHNSPLAMFRLTCDVVDREQARVTSTPGTVPALYNAVRQTWDGDTASSQDVEDGEEVLVNCYSQAFDRGVLVAAVRADDQWFIVPHHVKRLAVTSNTGGEDGWYPEEADNPNVYCITFSSLPYPQTPGRFSVHTDPDVPTVEGDVFFEAMATAPAPHATVFNFGSDYLPEGTPVAVFQCNGQWFTDGALGASNGQLFPAGLTDKADQSVVTGTLTSGSPDVTGLADVTYLAVDQPVKGHGVPTGATVIGVLSSTSIRLSANATASGSQTLTFKGPPITYTFVEAFVNEQSEYEGLEGGTTSDDLIELRNTDVDIPDDVAAGPTWVRPFRKDAGPAVAVTCTFTSGSTVVSGMTGVYGFRPGYKVFGTGIPPGETIHDIVSDTSFHLSAAATASGTKAVVAPWPNGDQGYEFMWFGGADGTSGKGSKSYCNAGLAALQKTDVLEFTAQGSTSVLAVYAAGSYFSVSDLTFSVGGYDFKSVVRFWYVAGEPLHCSIAAGVKSGGVSGSGSGTLLELIPCGDGCFTGGPLTGHLPDHGWDSCEAPMFTICVACTPTGISIDTIIVPCCGGVGTGVPTTLYGTITGSTGCNGTFPMYQTGGTSAPIWDASGPVGTCGPDTDSSWWPQFWCESLNWHARAINRNWTFVSADCVGLKWVFTCTLGGSEPCGCGTAGTTITLTITATPPPADCSEGNCGDAGVSAILTATVTGATGCCTSFPSTFALNCANTLPSGHEWVGPFGGLGSCGATSQPVIIQSGGAPQILMGGWHPLSTAPRPGYACYPFAAIYDLDDGAGNTCTVTVLG